MTTNHLHELKKKAFVRVVIVILALAAMFFLPAGTLIYWEAWVYMSVLFPPMFLFLLYLIRKDPELLERRMRMRERETEQKLIIKLATMLLVLTFLLPGFDKRFGWSAVHPIVVFVADFIVLLGYFLFVSVLKVNRYASRTIEVEQQQPVVTTGPYLVIRHPMYLATLLIYVFSPLALGSYWAMIPTVLLPILLIARIRNEEHVLLRDLKGYPEYIQKTKYRLIPGVW